MYRIDVPSASPTLPDPAAAGTPGYFRDGDPVAGQPGTVVPADWLNAVMLELLAIVVAGGGAPSKTNNGQVLAGIKGLFKGNLAANGHVEIPIGSDTLIINWGVSSTTDASGAKVVTFDQPYTTGVFSTFATNRGNGIPTAFHGTGVISNNGMTVYSAQSSGVAAGSGTAFAWLAIGL